MSGDAELSKRQGGFGPVPVSNHRDRAIFEYTKYFNPYPWPVEDSATARSPPDSLSIAVVPRRGLSP